jgi:hypothetical protein
VHGLVGTRHLECLIIIYSYTAADAVLFSNPIKNNIKYKSIIYSNTAADESFSSH